MSIQPQGEDLRKAVKWISEERKFNPNKKIKALIEEACIQFDLSPLIADFLQRKMLEEKTDSNLT
jgi:uroporphyrinogen-III decarboxylase